MLFSRVRTVLIVALGVAGLTMAAPRIACAQVQLAYKFPEGEKLTYRTTTRARQVLRLNNVNQPSNLIETKVWARSVGKRRGDSTLPVEEKVQSLRQEYMFPNRVTLTLDSNDPAVKIDNPDLAFLRDIFKLESEIAYSVVLDGQAKVKAIEGLEELKTRAGRIAGPIARAEIEAEIGADRLRRKFEQSIHNLPDGPARSGEPWERSELLEINGKPFTVRKKYEYRGTEKRGDKKLEKIGFKVVDIKYDQDPKSPLPLNVAKSDLTVESSEGTLLFAAEEGHLVRASERLRIKGNMTFLAAGVEQSAPFEFNLDANTQLEPATR